MRTQTPRPLAIEGCIGHPYAQSDPEKLGLAERLPPILAQLEPYASYPINGVFIYPRYQVDNLYLHCIQVDTQPECSAITQSMYKHQKHFSAYTSMSYFLWQHDMLQLVRIDIECLDAFAATQ